MGIIRLETPPLSQLLCNEGTELIKISFEEEEFDKKCPSLFGASVYL